MEVALGRYLDGSRAMARVVCTPEGDADAGSGYDLGEAMRLRHPGKRRMMPLR